jgi:hypothetical protein
VADLLADLVAYLDANTAWTAASDLFSGDMPPTPDDLTVIYEYPGGPPIETGGASGQPAIINPRVQVVARSIDYDLAKARARLAYSLLVVLVNQTVGASYYERAVPLQEPFLLSRDESERVLFAFNVEVFRDAE